MLEEQFRARLAQLRINKGVSARDMSLSIGQTESYINRIENGAMFPSMMGFFYICEYLHVTPQEFFAFTEQPPLDVLEACRKLTAMPEERRAHVLALINDLSK